MNKFEKMQLRLITVSKRLQSNGSCNILQLPIDFKEAYTEIEFETCFSMFDNVPLIQLDTEDLNNITLTIDQLKDLIDKAESLNQLNGRLRNSYSSSLIDEDAEKPFNKLHKDNNSEVDKNKQLLFDEYKSYSINNNARMLDLLKKFNIQELDSYYDEATIKDFIKQWEINKNNPEEYLNKQILFEYYIREISPRHFEYTVKLAKLIDFNDSKLKSFFTTPQLNLLLKKWDSSND